VVIVAGMIAMNRGDEAPLMRCPSPHFLYQIYSMKSQNQDDMYFSLNLWINNLTSVFVMLLSFGI
jgi:hypothetical protein